MKCLLLVAALVAAAGAQIPSLGFCPEYLPMPNFNMDRFTGIWHEAERYFQLTEVASRCVTSNYTKTTSGKYYVINEVMSRFTGVKRVLEGEIRRSPLRGEEGKLVVKYATVPVVPYESQYNVLETDYDSYAVLWSCTGIGPVHTQNAWIMTRERLAPGEVLQKAYGVLDRYKISKVFFVKTNQDDCAYLEENQVKPAEPPKKATTPKPAEAAEATEEAADEAEEAPVPLAGKSAAEVRPHIVPDAPEVIIQTRKAEIEAKEKAAEAAAAEKTVKAAAIQQPVVEIQADEAVRSVPEVIMKIADQAKQEVAAAPAAEVVDKKEIKESPVQEEIKKIVEEVAPVQQAAEPVVAPVKSEEPAIDAPKEVAPVVAPKEPVVAPKEPVVAPKESVVAEVEVKEPEAQQPLKQSEPIVQEKIEIAQP